MGRKNMQIYGPASVHGAQSINAPHGARVQPTQTPAARPMGDEVSISSTAQLLEQMQNLPEIRHDRVAQIKAAIQSGQYETADKLDGALERLLDEIG
jgi:flagellar biosynthesis anti-sigma factor FlgM